jgi:hypothetical protein
MLFRREHNELLVAKENLRDIDARYTRKVSSLWRTPHVDSPWMDKFLTLEKEYMALEKELSEARLSAALAHRQVRLLLDVSI